MFIKLYLIALPIFVSLDILWVGFIGKNFYFKQIGYLMKSEVNWLAIVLFYIIFISGLIFFVVMPGLEKSSLLYVVLAGAFLGLIAYGTYDLINLAITKDWPILVTVVDMLWGTILTSFVCSMVYLIANQIGLKF